MTFARKMPEFYMIIGRKMYFPIFTVRRYALHGLSYRNSVCLSVRPSVRPSVILVYCFCKNVFC